MREICYVVNVCKDDGTVLWWKHFGHAGAARRYAKRVVREDATVEYVKVDRHISGYGALPWAKYLSRERTRPRSTKTFRVAVEIPA